MAMLAAKANALTARLEGMSLPKDGWSAHARKEALARLTEMGLPSKRDEYWRYTDPTSLTAVDAPKAAVFDDSDNFPRAFFASETMGTLARTHDATFNAIHIEKKLRPNADAAAIAAFYGTLGIDQQRFTSTMQSFAVNANLGRARQFAVRSGISLRAFPPWRAGLAPRARVSSPRRGWPPDRPSALRAGACVRPARRGTCAAAARCRAGCRTSR